MTDDDSTQERMSINNADANRHPAGNRPRNGEPPTLAWIKAWCEVDDCWIWTRNKNSKGYGKFSVQKREVYVHRYVYELVHGPIPEGHQVLHSCDVRLCCNPDHLSTGTNEDNVADAVAKGRAWWQRTDGFHPRWNPRPDEHLQD